LFLTQRQLTIYALNTFLIVQNPHHLIIKNNAMILTLVTEELMQETFLIGKDFLLNSTLSSLKEKGRDFNQKNLLNLLNQHLSLLQVNQVQEVNRDRLVLLDLLVSRENLGEMVLMEWMVFKDHQETS